MSIPINISELTIEHKKKIIDDLQIELPQKKGKSSLSLNIIHVDENTDQLILPYSYAKQFTSLKLKSPARKTFTAADIRFEGTLREYQKEVKKKVIPQLNATGSCVLSLHVGWGKSIFAIYLASKLCLKTLIIVNRLILLKQWSELIEKVCPNSKFQILKPKSDIDDDCHFYLMNAMNVCKMGVESFRDIGTVICDEVHLLCAKTLYKSLYFLRPRYLLGLSATPYRPDGLGCLIDLFFGNFKITKKLFREHAVYEVHTGFEIDYKLNWEGKMDWNSVLNGQAEHSTRNDNIIRIVKVFSSRYFLVLCKRISQGRHLVELFQKSRISVTDLLGSKKDFDETARVVVATTQKCGVGFSHDRLNALIIASDVEEYFIQYLGRVFRTPDVVPIVFDFVDNLPILRRHYHTRKRVYKECGGTINPVYDLDVLLETV